MSFGAAYALAWSPVALVLFLVVGLRRPALDLSVAGFVYTFLLAWTVFRTPAGVLAAAGLDGVVKTLPLMLVILAGMALSTVLLAAGSLQRIVGWYSERVKGEGHRTALLALGIGNFMEGAGVIAEPVVAPMIRASGLSPTASAALSIQGYSGLMTLALGGIIIKVLALVTELPSEALAETVAVQSLLPTVLLAAAIPWVVEGWAGVRSQWRLFTATGALAALACWATVRAGGITVSAMVGGLAVIAGLVLTSGRRLRLDASILKDFAPLALILAGLSVASLVPGVRRVAYEQVKFVVTVIPGRPNALRPLFDAYTYLAAAVALSLLVHPFEPGQRGRLLGSCLKRGWRPLAATALFGAMGQMIAYSGYAEGFAAVDEGRNLASLLAQGTYAYTGSFYPIFAPLLGWVGTFLTGYGVASIMLFGKFQLAAAGLLGASPAALASALAVGASIGSISSPFKIALATPLCDAIGREGEILRKTLPLGLAVSLAVGIAVWWSG